MRIIKFRGKRLDNGEWVFGSFLSQYFSTKHRQVVDAIVWDDGGQQMRRDPVDPKTVGQFTGKTAKVAPGSNPPEDIFEGMIVRGRLLFTGQYDPRPEGKVIWHDSCFAIQTEKDGIIGLCQLQEFEILAR